MKQRKYFNSMAIAVIGSSLMTSVVQARTCSGNGDVVGSYGFTGSRAGFFLVGATSSTSGGPLIPVPLQAPGTTGVLIPVPVMPPGTTGAAGTVVMSNTPIGNLISGLTNRNVFAATGRLFADGMGNWYATPTLGTLAVNPLVGTYNVSADCSITMTVGDPFLNSAGTEGGITTTTGDRENRLAVECVDVRLV